MAFYFNRDTVSARSERAVALEKHMRRLGAGIAAAYNLLAGAPERTPAQEAWTPRVERR